MRPPLSLTLIFAVVLAVTVGCSRPATEDPPPTPPPAPPAEDTSRPEPGDDAMVLIPAGSFLMGSDVDWYNAPRWYKPEHEVALTAYFIDVYEVTFAQFARFVAESGYEPLSEWQKYFDEGKDLHPMLNARWEDATAYCKWAGKRLPTEAEWEHAARGPDNFTYPWGNDWRTEWSNTKERGLKDTLPVGSTPGDRSAFGLYDTQGNALEWVDGTFQPHPGSPVSDDPVFDSPKLPYRGSGFHIRGQHVALWYRMAAPVDLVVGRGFRCARSADGPP